MSKHSARTSDDPVIDTRVQEILTAAAAPVEATGPLPGEEQALEAFRTFAKPTKRPSRLSRHASVKAAVATAIGTGVLLAGGVGAAADGVLPGAAQQTVSTWLKGVGISVPGGQGADEHPNPSSSGQSSASQPGRPPTPNHDNGDSGGKSDRTGSPSNNGNSDGNKGNTNQGKADQDGNSNNGNKGKSNNKGKANNNGKQVSQTAQNSHGQGAGNGKKIEGVAPDNRAGSSDRGQGQTQGSQGNRPDGGQDH